MYCCNDGHFITNKTFEDSTIENKSEVDNQTFVDTSSNPSEAAAEVEMMVSDQIIKQAEDSKTSNLIKVADSKDTKIEIDLNKEIELLSSIESKPRTLNLIQ